MVKIQAFKLSSDKTKHKNKTRQHIGDEKDEEERHEYKVIHIHWPEKKKY